MWHSLMVFYLTELFLYAISTKDRVNNNFPKSVRGEPVEPQPPSTSSDIRASGTFNNQEVIFSHVLNYKTPFEVFFENSQRKAA